MSVEHEERDIVSLPLPERLCIWAIRAWTEHADNLSVVWASLEAAYAQADIPTALAPLHQFLVALDHHAVRFPEIRPHGTALSNDERCLLTSVCFAQQGRIEAVRSLLKKWLPVSGTRLPLEYLMQYAAIEQRAGHDFALPRVDGHDGGKHLAVRAPPSSARVNALIRPILRLATLDGKRLF